MPPHRAEGARRQECHRTPRQQRQGKVIDEMFGMAEIDARQQHPQKASRHQQPHASDQKSANTTTPSNFMLREPLYYRQYYQSIRISSMCALSEFGSGIGHSSVLAAGRCGPV